MEKSIKYFIIIFLCFSGCTLEDDTYLPNELYTGTLTGEEILFWPCSWYSLDGIFASTDDGNMIYRLTDFDLYGGGSPSFLSDKKIIAIKKTEPNFGGKDDLIIIDKGNVSELNIPLSAGEKINFASGLKGVNGDKIAYVISDELSGTNCELRIYSLSAGMVTGTVSEGGNYIVKPAALPDGRIAYLIDGNVKLVDNEGNEESLVPLPETFAEAVFALSDSRLIIACIDFSGEIRFLVSAAGPSEPWTQITGFSPTLIPTASDYSMIGVQVFGTDKLAFIHCDDDDDSNPKFIVLTGEIAGTSITNTKKIFETSVVKKVINPVYGGSSYTESQFLWWNLYN